MKRLWHRIEYSLWDNDCGVVNTSNGSLYFYKHRPISYDEYKNRLMNYFKDFDEDY